MMDLFTNLIIGYLILGWFLDIDDKYLIILALIYSTIYVIDENKEMVYKEVPTITIEEKQFGKG